MHYVGILFKKFSDRLGIAGFAIQPDSERGDAATDKTTVERCKNSADGILQEANLFTDFRTG